MLGDDPPYLSVGTEVSAKYKGAFCEAKIRKVVKSVKCKILFKQGLGMASVVDDAVKGTIRVGSSVEARHPERKEYVDGTITKIQDCSQYTVVFDDGDITTLRRTALCLKSGRHFAESETLDQLPLTHPEHFGNPVMGGRRGRRRGGDEDTDDEETAVKTKVREEKEADIGRVVCVEGDKKKQRDNWFPGLVVAPTAQDTVRIHVREEYLVRSFKDGRYYTVPKKETTEFTREAGSKVDNHSVKAAVEKALLFLDKNELPPHWDRELLFGLNEPSNYESDHDTDSDNPDDEPREEKDHFVAQLYKFMDDRGTPINQGPTICNRDVDLYRLFYVVHNLGGYNRVTNHNHWKTVSRKLGYGQSPVNVNLVKHVYKRFLHSFEEFYRKLGCTMVSHPRTYRNRSRAGRSLIRDKDKQGSGGIKSDSKERDGDGEVEEGDELNLAEDVKEEPGTPVEPTPSSPKVKCEPPPLNKSTEKEKIPIKVKEIKEEKKDDEVKVKTDPVKIKTEPVKVKTEPVKVKPEPVKVKTEPVKVKPEPAKVKPEPAKVKLEPVKVKTEPVKVKTEPVKEKTRMRTKMKSTESSPVKKEIKEKEIKKDFEIKEEEKPEGKSVEKKKRLFTRSLKREKMGLLKNSPGLALTRQKRAIKDRVKAIVDKFKFKITKDSSSVASDSSDKSVSTNKDKPVKVKEEAVPTPLPAPGKKKEELLKEAAALPLDEKKKVGRKKKEKKDSDETFDSLPTYKTVCVGDKLKVYYGPTNESKVTYEAKVLGTKTEGSEVMYLVHYTGWNNRYDEYIKHSRIADNLSWVPGRSSKKPALSFLKPRRRKNSVGKQETSPGKGDGVTTNKGESKIDMSTAKGNSQHLSANSQSKTVKNTITRSSWRNAKKDEGLSENEMDEDTENPIPSLYMSDELLSEKTQSEKVKEILGISDESSLVSVTERRKTKRRPADEPGKSDAKESPDLCSANTSQSPKVDRRKKRSLSESENQDILEKKTRYIGRSRRSSSATKDKSDTNNSGDIDSGASGDEMKEMQLNDVWNFEPRLEMPDSCGTAKKRRFAEKKFEVNSNEANSQQGSCAAEDSSLKCSNLETEEASKGRDFDLKQIRSELKGLDKAVKSEVDSFKPITSDSKTTSERKSEAEKLAEDIYEFKEPEPFEFEVRKSSEDKSKSQRRPLGRLFEDSKKMPSVSLPNMFYKGKKEIKEEEQKNTFLNAIYNFEEESDDNLNSPPRRTEGDDTSKQFQLFTDLPDEDTKKYDVLNVYNSMSQGEALDKSEEVLSPSLSPKSNSPIIPDLNENSNFDSNEVESTSKSGFSRDEDEDELGDESINFAIQRAIKREISDDEDEPAQPPTLISVESSIFSTGDENVPNKPVIVESVVDKNTLDGCLIMDKADKSECDDKSDDELSNSTESDEESDFIMTSMDRDDDIGKTDKNSDDSINALVSSPVLINTTVADNVMITGEELVSSGSIITPIVVPPDSKDTTVEFSNNSEQQLDEAIYPVTVGPLSSKCDEDPIEAIMQEDTNDSDRSTQEMETISQIMQEETVKIEPSSEFTFKPITVPPPDESESTVSIPYTENKSNDEIIINLEPLKPPDEVKPDEEEEKADLNLASLLCEETIPGSPSSHMECCEQAEDEKVEPASVEIEENRVERIEEVTSQPIIEEEVKSDDVTEMELGEITDSSKSTRECEDTENYAKESDEEREITKTPTKQEISRKPTSCSKRPRPVKKRHTESVKRRYNRSRQTGSDSDDTSENSNTGGFNQPDIVTPESEIKDPVCGENVKAACRYNFLVTLEPGMDQNTRITLIQNSIQQIRKVYADLKSELAMIDRRRKKLRKRERESLAAVRMH